MFEEIGEPVSDVDAPPPPADPVRLLAIASHYGLEFKVADDG